MTDLQKPNMGKRIMSGLFDGILLITLAIGLATLLSFCFGYEAQLDRFTAIVDRYEQQYGIRLEITTEEYESMSPDAQKEYMEKWNAIDAALRQDAEYTALNMTLSNLRMMILSFSLLIAVLLMEFFVPLMFGNGQTLGKKIFGIGVMHIESIRITGPQMFIRSVLGKYTVELMLPVYIALLTLGGSLGIVGVALLVVLAVVQVVCILITRTNAPIHDIFASTVTVDFASQRIFEDREDRDNYIKAMHAEKVSRAEY